MRFAVSAPNVGDPRRLVALAHTAERAGWDGFFLWDHLHLVRAMRLDVFDPWVVLGAVAQTTERVRLGTMVTPVARRRPWKLAKEIVTLDHLSAGRAIVGVGLGWPADDDFAAFGEEPHDRARAERYDEGLGLLDRFLRGEPVRHAGATYAVDAELRPGTVQTPRPPIWVAAMGHAARPLARAARYDGVAPITADATPITPEALAAVVADLPPHAEPFDVVSPWAPGHGAADYTAAGATWLVTSRWPDGDWYDDLAADVAAGPPA